MAYGSTNLHEAMRHVEGSERADSSQMKKFEVRADGGLPGHLNLPVEALTVGLIRRRR